jgi:hypothetical protein
MTSAASVSVSDSTAWIGDGVEEVINQFKSWGHRVVALKSDYENVFRSLKSRVNGLGVQLQHSARKSVRPGSATADIINLIN